MKRTGFARLCFALMVLAIVPLSGCARMPNPAEVARMYTEYLRGGDYGSCYSLVDGFTRDAIALNIFVDKHNAVYDAIGLSAMDVAVGQPRREGTAYFVPTTLHYETEQFGVITHTFEMQMTQQDEEWYIRWNPSYMLPDYNWSDTASTRTLRPKRGEILDAEQNPYAISSYAQTAYASLPDIKDDLETFVVRVGSILGMSTADITALINEAQSREQDTVVLQTYLPGTLPEEVEDALTRIPGAKVDSGSVTPIRYYPQGPLLSHIVGYTSPINEEELAKADALKYDRSSRIGRTGLEASFESVLCGQRGMELFIRDQNGVRKSTVARREPVDGLDLELTIDYELQRRADRLLRDLPDDVSGTIICMDPTTGEVTAMAAYPSFDPNIFTFSMAPAELEALEDPELGQPLFNRLTQGTYPPGSIIKPFVAALGLMSGEVTPDWEFKGRIDERKWTPADPWPYPPITRVSDYSGAVNMENAIVHSDNIYFAAIAMDMGWNRMEPFLKGIGFTQKMPFDVPVKESRIFNKPNYDNRRLLADTGYGQGQMLITPLQMAATFCALANEGGDIPTPYVVKALKRMEGTKYVTQEEKTHGAWISGALDGEALETLRPMLRRVMTRGSGRQANVKGMELMGKTGTAELDDVKKREIAWMCVSAAGEYNRVVCVTLEIPADTGEIRYEIVREMLAP